MFAYCRNNPICRRDVSGASEEQILDCTPNLDEDKLDGKASTGSGMQVTVGNVGGAGSGGNGGGGKVTLFRAMSPVEYSNTIDSQQFSSGANSYEDAKYFATTYENAAKWGSAMYPDGNYRVMTAVFSAEILSSPGVMYWPNLDGIGPAYLLSLSETNNYMVSIY